MLETVLGVILIVVLIYLLLAMPRLGPKRAGFFVGKNIAHRGLHNHQDAVPENSLAAFRLAVQAGFGIELDLQLSADGQVVIFHDRSLYRMTGISADLHHLTYKDLASLRLLDSDERIPTLENVLFLVDGMVPLLVELKSTNQELDEALCIQTAEILDRYSGPFAIESFNPVIVNWFRKNRPQYVRGQLAIFGDDKEIPLFQRIAGGLLITNFWTQPDFIAYFHKQGGLFPLQVCKHIWRTVTVGWTIRSIDEYKAANRIFDSLVFENIMPSTSFVKGKLATSATVPAALHSASSDGVQTEMQKQ